MKKLLAMFLALTLAFTMPGAVFAENETESTASEETDHAATATETDQTTADSTVLKLTGDAANEVANLKDGQSVTTKNDVTVRLNVQNDPEKTEYTVAMNGERVEEDHSTSQYHFYYLQAAQMNGEETTVSVSTQALSQGTGTAEDSQTASADSLQIRVGDETYDVELTGGGTSSKERKTVTVTVPHGDEGMKRIYVIPMENDTLELSSSYEIAGKGYTTNSLYFIDKSAQTNQQQSQTINVTRKEGDTSYYYAVKVIYSARSGRYLGSNGKGYSEASPGGMSTYDSSTGYINGMVKFSTMTYAGMYLYKDGTGEGTTEYEPDWSALETSTNKLYYLSGTYAYFGRPGFYWIPVTDGETSGLLPMKATCVAKNVEDMLSKAESVKNSDHASTEAKEMFTAAMEKVQSFNESNNVAKALYLNDDGTYPDNLDKTAGIFARSYFGAQLYGFNLIEKELNTVLDLTDIFTTWGTDAELAAQQFKAYQEIMNMDGGIHTAMDIQSVDDRDLYQKIRQAKWNVVKATDLDSINAALTTLGLDSIGEEESKVTLGDVNNDGQIDIKDISLMIRYWNDAATFTDTQLKAADLNEDGNVDIKDISLLIRYYNEAIDSFPAEGKS